MFFRAESSQSCDRCALLDASYFSLMLRFNDLLHPTQYEIVSRVYHNYTVCPRRKKPLLFLSLHRRYAPAEAICFRVVRPCRCLCVRP